MARKTRAGQSLTHGTQTVGFTYDNANRRTKVTLPNGVDVNYVYDNASQLNSITYKKGATTLGDLVYTYDAAGRRTQIGGSFARTDLPTGVTTSSHNANNQVTQWGGAALTYDLNGNVTSDGTYTYTWSARNQLIQVQQGSTTIASYQYDAFGRRKEKVVSGVTTRYVHDGKNFIQERDATNAVTANLTTGFDLDQVYARTKGAVTSSFLMDHLGTIVAETDAAGGIQTSYGYEPYGKTAQTGPLSDNSQRYTAREHEFADVYYYRARYYSSRLGRFVSEDPIGIAGGNNQYRYAMSDPISLKDPLGLRARGECEPPCDQSYLDCLAACISGYDPLSGAEKFGLTAAGGTFPKAWAGLPRGLGGASSLTTVPSVAAHILGGGAAGTLGSAIRGLGRVGSWGWIGYGVGMAAIEVMCAIECADDSCAY